MLKKIPDSVVPFARDGVLSATRLGHADSAERLERHARKRAADMVASARSEEERLFAEASRAGYGQGLELAFSTCVPKLVEMFADQAQFKSQVRQALEHYIRVALTDAGVEAALIARCCEAATDADEATSNAWTLYVPEDRCGLVETLGETCPEVLRVCQGEAPWPVLERGDVVIEFDSQRPVARHLVERLDAALLQEGLDQRAQAYADDVLNALREGRPWGRHPHDSKGETA